MKTFLKMATTFVFTGLAVAMFAGNASAQKAYVVTNDDNYTAVNTMNIYMADTGGTTELGYFSTNSYGGGGGYFGLSRQAIASTSTGSTCIFVADAGGTANDGVADIASFKYGGGTFTLVQDAVSKGKYSGGLDGVGI